MWDSGLYLPLKVAHVSLVAASGLLFAARGMAVVARQPWPMRKPWRVASYVIDTLLASAGVALWAMLSLNPLTDSPWLGTKLALLLAYIVLGSLALKRGRTPRARAASFIAAIGTYLLMASVAIRHSPMGVFA